MTRDQATLPPRGGLKAHRTAGTASMLLLCGLSAGALGATNSIVDCQEFSSSPHDLAESNTGFVVSLVDLPERNTELGLAEPFSESTAPVLYLTPRVAEMLRQVFEEDVSDRGLDRKSLLPPVAKDNDDKSALPSLQEPDLNDESDIRLQFHHRMYRTDI